MPRKGISLINAFVDRKRFDIYGKTDLEVDRFSAFVKKLPAGRVVAIAITDTAVAAKRPPSDKLYDALRLLGAPAQMEKIGYRFPFAFLGVKGGTGHLLMDKTKFLLRIDAALAANGAISDVTTEKTDVTAKVILASAGKKRPWSLYRPFRVSFHFSGRELRKPARQAAGRGEPHVSTPSTRRARAPIRWMRGLAVPANGTREADLPQNSRRHGRFEAHAV